MQGFWKQLAAERDKGVKVCVVVVVMVGWCPCFSPTCPPASKKDKQAN